jgi:heme O synthase-like polyprenyltransferase
MSMRAWLELARLSNVPTVVSNVLVGAAIGVRGGSELSPPRVAVAAAAVLLLYVAGMALNDVLDVEVDRIERPKRPIPSGRISRRNATIFIIGCMLVALALLASLGTSPLLVGTVLAAAIILYDAAHRRFAASILVLGACRGLTYGLATSAILWPPPWPILLTLACALALYVVSFSMVARVEMSGISNPRRRLALALAPAAAAFAPLLILHPRAWSWWHIAAIAGLGLWLAHAALSLLAAQPRMRQAIMAWIAGIALFDAMNLTLLDQPVLALMAAACFLITLAGHRSIAGT